MIKDFHFPGTPYSIQEQFMNNLYECLSSCRGGLFESPTGTGKTLSIICGSLTFLSDHLRNLSEQSNSTDSPIKPIQVKSTYNVRFDSLRSTSSIGPAPKIVYLTRTHSQLDQFTSELKKTIWGQNNLVRLVRLASRSQICVNEEVNQDKSLIDYNCKILNSKVNNDDEDEAKEELEARVLKDIRTEKRGVAELLKVVNGVKEVKAKQKQQDLFEFVRVKKRNKRDCDCCPFFLQREQAVQRVLSSICDIEDLVRMGKQISACPYYGTRAALIDADIILAPYTSMLNKKSRTAIGIDLSGSFLVIDESHNIINAITDCHSGAITERQVAACMLSIETYRRVYLEKMFPRKLMFVDLSLRILRVFSNFIQSHRTTDYYHESRDNFINRYNMQDISFFDVWDFYEEQAMPLKMFNIGNKREFEAKFDLSALKTFHELLSILDENDCEFLMSKDPQTGQFSIKYMLLNPYEKFKILLNEAACVVLAGGTLTPHQEFTQLFSCLPATKFRNFSCGHVVPENNLVLSTISYSGKGNELKFTFDNRESLRMFTDLGEILYKLCLVVPHGVVVFLPSYAFLTRLQEMMSETYIPQINTRKEVFFDNRDENILKNFSEAAETRGAILFAVIRGSLSEGINFSDRLGRCIVIVGMPYLNLHDPEVIVKKMYYDRTKWYSGQKYYENSCDVAINQSIGRAIRHAKDFAAVILIDSRHAAKVANRPEWMKRSYRHGRNTDDVVLMVKQFFRSKINA